MSGIPRFSRNELIIPPAIGILSPLADERIERLLPQLFGRYDIWSAVVAGLAAQFFWMPYSYGMHNALAVFGLRFVPGDIVVRFVGGAFGNCLVGGLLGVIILNLGSLVKTPKGPSAGGDVQAGIK